MKGLPGPRVRKGQKGEIGAIGPAGEDGSVMYARSGEPSADVGVAGDYYLNSDTGELYGPKDSDGWGEPIIVLMGEDGQDGADGKDGSVIHAGSGTPSASLGVIGDFYLDKNTGNFYGPKTENG